LVSDLPGTTRDGLQEEISVGNIICRLQDSAGLGMEGAESGPAGQILAWLSQDATRQVLSQADLVLVLLDGSTPLTIEDNAVLRETDEFKRVLVITKNDLPPAWPEDELDIYDAPRVAIAVKQGDLRKLEEQIALALLDGHIEPSAAQVIVSTRQSLLLQELQQVLFQVENLLQSPDPQWELIAWELQQALKFQADLDGQGARDEVLEEIFSNFCLGK
jgi:tRNA modification GTPase